mmetsp:Transcript_60298/g.147971  ORF Transcript_60298/g.147971 Transcript_60298/m.147971 type:complete len:112 (-) Transcript_60298:50-385(-)
MSRRGIYCLKRPLHCNKHRHLSSPPPLPFMSSSSFQILWRKGLFCGEVYRGDNVDFSVGNDSLFCLSASGGYEMEFDGGSGGFSSVSRQCIGMRWCGWRFNEREYSAEKRM